MPGVDKVLTRLDFEARKDDIECLPVWPPPVAVQATREQPLFLP
jgi:hypothetical protein